MRSLIKKLATVAVVPLAAGAIVATASPASAATNRWGDLAECNPADRVHNEISMPLATASVSVTYDACVEDLREMGPRLWTVTSASEPALALHGLPEIPLVLNVGVEPGSWHGEYTSAPTYEFVYVQRFLSFKKLGVVNVRYPMRLTIYGGRAELCIDQPLREACETRSIY